MVAPTGPPMPPTQKKPDPPPELVKADKAYVEASKNKYSKSMLEVRKSISLAITEGHTIARVSVAKWPDYILHDVLAKLESLHYKVRVSSCWTQFHTGCEKTLYIRFPNPKLEEPDLSIKDHS